MKNIGRYIVSLVFALGLLAPSSVLVQAQQQGDVDISGSNNTLMGRLQEVVGGENGAYNLDTDENTFVDFSGYIISVVFGLFGVIFVALIVYAGYNWMTANGAKEKVSKAQTIIIAAILGLLVTIAAYAIWQFVFIRIMSGGL